MSQTTSLQRKETKPDKAFKRRVFVFVEKHGDVEAARLLGLSRYSMVRVAAGLAVRPSTLLFMRTQLDNIAPVKEMGA